MCILCDQGALEVLTTPLERLEPGQLGEAVRTAREAAGAGVVDRAEAILRGEILPDVGPRMYQDLVVDRALEAGTLARSDAHAWQTRLGVEAGVSDPRVQAFVSTCAEILDDYRVLVDTRRSVVERYVEAHGDAIAFSSLGPDGEPWFEYRGQAYAALTRAEALEIVQRELTAKLRTLEPEVLIRYSGLPDTTLDVLAEVREEPPAVASVVLARMVDLPALAEDQIAAGGFAPFFRDEQGRPAEDLRFGEWIIIRTALP